MLLAINALEWTVIEYQRILISFLNISASFSKDFYMSINTFINIYLGYRSVEYSLIFVEAKDCDGCLRNRFQQCEKLNYVIVKAGARGF